MPRLAFIPAPIWLPVIGAQSLASCQPSSTGLVGDGLDFGIVVVCIFQAQKFAPLLKSNDSVWATFDSGESCGWGISCETKHSDGVLISFVGNASDAIPPGILAVTRMGWAVLCRPSEFMGT